MRRLPSDTYNIAWFKLAEFVTRGEKERALGMFRLLAHSFDDQAVVLQLEGDLLAAFDDHAAYERYAKAAEEFRANNRLVEAAAVCNHMLSFGCDHNLIFQELIAIYKQMGNELAYAQAHEGLFFAEYRSGTLSKEELRDLAQEAAHLLVIHQEYYLQRFLSKLQALDAQIYSLVMQSLQ